MLIVEPEHHSTAGLAHSLTEAAKHPSVFHLFVAGAEAVMHATKEHTFTILVRQSSLNEAVKLSTGCNQATIVKMTTAAATAGIQVSVVNH